MFKNFTFCTSTKLCLSTLLVVLGCLAAPETRAQALVTATPNLSCAGTRIGSDANCTANDFATVVSFTQDSANAIASCVAGSTLTVSVQALTESNSPNRYDIGYFFGQTANDPSQNGTGLCSVAPLPSTPAPLGDLEPPPVSPSPDSCGDMSANGAITVTISNIVVTCNPVPGGNEVALPYRLVWGQNSGDYPYTFGGTTYSSCNANSIRPGTTAKCNGSVLSNVIGLTVQGWLRIVKNTVPATATQTFSFSATGPSGVTLSTSSFNLAHSQSMTITMALGTSTRSITVTEALIDGWEPGASIVCVRPDGSPATFVTVDNANRRIVANLFSANNAAICTYTNTKQTRVRVTKSLQPPGAAGSFNLSVGNGATLTSALNVGNGGTTSYLSVGTTTTRITETAALATTTMADYITTITCSVDGSGAPVTLTSSVTSGATRSAVLSPVVFENQTCVFTNTRAAGLSISKTNGTDTLVAGTTTSYTITVANTGPSSANGAIVTDPSAPGDPVPEFQTSY
jgi:uncharacterized repeat protein (TIGR01451 family)